MADKEKIREDLIRLQNSINECIDDLAIARDRKDDGEELIALRRMESLLGDVKQTCIFVLNSLKEESVSEELEEAIEQSFIYHENRGDDFRSDEQIGTTYRNGFESGAKWKKEQMMSKAKGGTVQKDYQIIMDDGTWIDLDPSMQLKPAFNVNVNDKVKVIVTKED